MRLEHTIFQQPLDAGVTLEPDDWNQDFDDRGVWLVQDGELGEELDYGVVSDGHGFEDSPDCERISGGINSKGPWAVAIGREANMLQWGFYAAPDRMTESAKRAFLNAIVYMKQFDGDRPLVEKVARGRGWVEQMIAMIGDADEMPEGQRVSFLEYLEGRFPKTLIDEVGLDQEALGAWRVANVEYLRDEGRGKHVVDEDLAEHGLSNRRPEFLEFVHGRLSKDPSDALALRLAERYMDRELKDAKAILAWIDENRERAFFSDVGGFRWFADTRPERVSDAKAISASAGGR